MKHTYINDETLKAHYWNTDGFSLKFPQQRHDRCLRKGQGGTASIPSSPTHLWHSVHAPPLAMASAASSGHGAAGHAAGRGRAGGRLRAWRGRARRREGKGGSRPSHRGVKEWWGREKEWRASHRGVNARFLVVSCNILQCSGGCFESSIGITTEISNNN